MSELPHPGIAWGPAWADVQDRDYETNGCAIVIAAGQVNDGPDYVMAWPGQDLERVSALVAAQPGARLTLVGSDAEGINEFARSHGLECVQNQRLLTAPSADMTQMPELPERAQLAGAPMETYDVVEISLFDHPVGRGRVSWREGCAVARITESPEGKDHVNLERALVAAMAEEAFLQGADCLTMVIESGQSAPYETSGWTAGDHVLSFEKH